MGTLISRFKKFMGDSIKQLSGDKSINNIGSHNINIQINIENVIIDHGLFNHLKENYKLIYQWHKETGVKYFISKVGQEFSRQYIDYVNTLKDPDEAGIDDIISLANQIKNGVMNWSALQEIHGKLSSELAQSILNNKDKIFITRMIRPEDLKGNQFYDYAEKIIAEIDDNIKEIKEKDYEKENIGGAIFFLQTNAQFSKEVIGTPKLLGFERVADPNALVNLALNGDIEINNVELRRGDDHNNHFVYLEITNLRGYDLKFYIPKGQIFENKDSTNITQNLLSSEPLYDIIPANNEFVPITINAYCLNESMKLPKGAEGNITLFELKNKDFENGDQLWEIVEKNWTSFREKIN